MNRNKSETNNCEVDKPLVSVIIPVYNQEERIIQCLESVLNQTYENIEVLVIDDGSTDGTTQKIEEFKMLDNRVHLFPEENSGPATARNRGINEAKGRFYCFLDSDDSIYPNFVQTMVDRILADQSDICICGYIMIDQSGIQKRIRESDGCYGIIEFTPIVAKWMDNPLIGATWNKMYDSVIIREHSIRFPEGQTWGEDINFILDFLSVTEQVSVSSDCLYNYFVNDFSLSQTNHSKYSKDLMFFWTIKLHTYKKLEKLVTRYNNKENVRILNLFLSYAFSIIHISAKNDKKEDLKTILTAIKSEINFKFIDIITMRNYFSSLSIIRAFLLCKVSTGAVAVIERLVTKQYKKILGNTDYKQYHSQP